MAEMLEFREWCSIVSIYRSFISLCHLESHRCWVMWVWMLCGEHKSKLLQMDTTFLSFLSSVSYLFLFYFSLSLAFLFGVCCLQQLSMEKLNEHTHIANYEAVLNGYSFNRNQLSTKLMCTHFDDLNSPCPRVSLSPHPVYLSLFLASSFFLVPHKISLVPWYLNSFLFWPFEQRKYCFATDGKAPEKA